VPAVRDAKAYSKFFHILGLKVAHNFDKAMHRAGAKECYRADVVLGDIAFF
jgi:hypothetical protein